MFAGIRVSVEGDVEAIHLPGTDEGDLAVIKEAIGGGWVTAINLWHPETGRALTIWLDEEGANKGQRTNVPVTRLAEAAGFPFLPGDSLRGHVVISGVNPPDVGPIPEEWHGILSAVGFIP